MNTVLQQVGQISVGISNLERAVAFYRDVLRLKYLFWTGNMAFFDCGGVRLMLAMPEKPGQAQTSSILYFKVEDIEAAAADLSTRGVAFEAKPHLVAKMPNYELWMAFFRDSEQNLMALMSEKASAPK